VSRALIEKLLATVHIRRADSSPKIAWSEDEVAELQALLTFEGAELWFYRSVQQKGIAIPDAFRAALRTTVQRQSVINMRIDAQTIAVTTMLDAASIPWALLKGQARRAAVELYPFADARTVSDVDLLVPEPLADTAWNLLLSNGFRRVKEASADWSADHHRPTLIDAANVAVELHTTTAMSIAPAEAWRRATENAVRVEWSGIETTVPSATELVWQALAHGASDGPEGYTLRAFLSVAAVLAPAPRIDWHVIVERIEAREALDNLTKDPLDPERLRRFLAIAASLAGVSVPADLHPRSPVSIVPLLAWRGQVLNAGHGRAWKGRLIEESTRVETLTRLTPSPNGSPWYLRLRRWTASRLARAMYQRHLGR
jgi:hypothetical protein